MEELLHLLPTFRQPVAASGDPGSSSLDPILTATERGPVAQPGIGEPIGRSQETDEEKASPLAFRLGKVYISPKLPLPQWAAKFHVRFNERLR